MPLGLKKLSCSKVLIMGPGGILRCVIFDIPQTSTMGAKVSFRCYIQALDYIQYQNEYQTTDLTTTPTSHVRLRCHMAQLGHVIVHLSVAQLFFSCVWRHIATAFMHFSSQLYLCLILRWQNNVVRYVAWLGHLIFCFHVLHDFFIFFFCFTTQDCSLHTMWSQDLAVSNHSL